MTHQLHQSTPFVPRPLEILTLVMPPSSSAIGAPYMRPDLFQPQHAVLPQAQAPPSAEDLTLYTTLAAYADALDALPLDLTRSFSDLRELDAVLGGELHYLSLGMLSYLECHLLRMAARRCISSFPIGVPRTPSPLISMLT